MIPTCAKSKELPRCATQVLACCAEVFGALLPPPANGQLSPADLNSLIALRKMAPPGGPALVQAKELQSIRLYRLRERCVGA